MEDKDLNLVGCLSGLVLVPVSNVWSGWVFTRLWGWFVVPQFHMAPISLPVVVGLNAMFLMYSKVSTKKSWTDLWLLSLIIPGVALGIGYVAHLFQ